MTYKNSLLVFTTIIILLSFVYAANLPKENRFLSDLNTLVQQARKLNETADAFKFNKTSIEELKKELAKTRIQYKQIEFLIEFYYPSFTEDKLNGAPLLHVEHSNDSPLVLPPEGLQVLDETIFSDEFDKSQVAILAKRFESSCSELENGNKGKKITRTELIEAMKFQITRISTLGITGFDTPGSANALNEAYASIEGMALYFDLFFSEMKEYTAVQDLFLSSKQYVANKSITFESFNRLEFIREYLNPLYSKLNKFYVSENISSSSVNQKANSMFDEDFLDPYFFTILTSEEDSEELKQLGKKLFFDSKLSGNSKMSCGSCHSPDMAFTDGVKKSMSNKKGETVSRNAPTLINSVYSDRYFYDLRAFNLEQQMEHVIFNSKEYNTAYEAILNKLKEDKLYKKSFSKIFKKKEITRMEFSKALSSYVLSLQSFDSEFDKYMRKEINTIDQGVINGFNLFMGKAACGTCHFPPTYAGLVPPYYNKNESEILGVLETPMSFNKRIDADAGRINNGLPGEKAWIFNKSFKTSTVRNVEFTGPYFHNGAYPTLESVMEFYNHGGGAGIGLNVKNQTLSSDSLHLSTSEIGDIILFLNSLSDTNS